MKKVDSLDHSAMYDQANKYKILVTGIHNSGTTILGKSLARVMSAKYVWEPSNKVIFKEEASFWYEGDKENENYQGSMQINNMEKSKNPNLYTNKNNSITNLTKSKCYNRIREIILSRKISNYESTIIKDPFACFAIEKKFTKNFPRDNFSVFHAFKHPLRLALSFNKRKQFTDPSELIDYRSLRHLTRKDNQCIQIISKNIKHPALKSSMILSVVSFIYSQVYRDTMPKYLPVKIEVFINLYQECMSQLLKEIHFNSTFETFELIRKTERYIHKRITGIESIENIAKHSIILNDEYFLMKKIFGSNQIEICKELLLEYSLCIYNESDWIVDG